MKRPSRSTSEQPAHQRRRLSAEQRRDQLMRATVTVVASAGYRNSSMSAIAAEAGMSKGLIWHYFAGGDELMEATARATLITVRDAVAADLDLSAPIPQVIRAAIHRAARLHRTHRDELRALREIVDNLRHPDGTHRLDLDEYEQTYQQQAALFRRGQDEGTMRQLDTRYLAVTYQGAVDAMLAYLDAHPLTDVDQYAEAVADILLGGMTSPSQHHQSPPAEGKA